MTEKRFSEGFRDSRQLYFDRANVSTSQIGSTVRVGVDNATTRPSAIEPRRPENAAAAQGLVVRQEAQLNRDWILTFSLTGTTAPG